MRICTIGYERAAFADFAEALVGAGVTSVIDVRAAPHSRRREFAFKHLGPELAEYGIRYESWPELGTPRRWRGGPRRNGAIWPPFTVLSWASWERPTPGPLSMHWWNGRPVRHRV